jgi:hypothetical protein
MPVSSNCVFLNADSDWEDSSRFSSTYWKRCITRVGEQVATLQLDELLTVSESFASAHLKNRIRGHFEEGLKQAGPVLRMRAKMAEQELADRQRERNAERNRKKREAKKRLRTARPTAARPSPVQ